MKLTDGERKFVDFLLTGENWEETERIQLYRKLGKSLDEKQANKIQELSEEVQKLKSIKLKNK